MAEDHPGNQERPGSDEDLGRRLAELEKNLVTRKKAEDIAAGAALDVLKVYEKEVRHATDIGKELAGVLDKKEFARRVAASLDERVCLRRLIELTGDVDTDEIEQAIEAKVGDTVSSRLESPEFAEKLKGLAPRSEDIREVSKRLAERMDMIEQEALPRLVGKLLDEKLAERLGAVSAETITAKVEELVGKALAEKLDDEALRQEVLEFARGSLGDIANAPEFKSMLDEKFKVMITYITHEVIPKQVRRLMGG